MTAPTPNAELAYRILDQIDADPESWRQSYWFTLTDCGTAGCLAGWACMLSGDKASPYGDLTVGDTFAFVETADGQRVHAEDRAMELLGIELDDAYRLFSDTNTREDLGRLVAEIFGPRPADEFFCGDPNCSCGDDVPPNAGSAS